MKPRWILVSLLLFSGGASIFAAAPESIAGKVIHLEVALPALRSIYLSTGKLEADGRYTEIIYGSGNTLNPPTSFFLHTRSFPKEWHYVYRKVDETHGTIAFDPDIFGNTEFPRTLTFLTDASGRIGTPDISTNDSVFSLSDPAGIQTDAPVLNTSLRGRVTPDHPLIAGIYIPGTEPRQVLIRVCGPGLAQFGVKDVWADPNFGIYSGEYPLPVVSFRASFSVHYSDWSDPPPLSDGTKVDPVPALQKLFATLGEFPLPVGSKDAVQLVTLTPGAFTIVARTAAGDPGGEALIEIYPLP